MKIEGPSMSLNAPTALPAELMLKFDLRGDFLNHV